MDVDTFVFIRAGSLVALQPAVRLDKQAPVAVQPGQPLTYTLQAVNTGAGSALNVTVWGLRARGHHVPHRDGRRRLQRHDGGLGRRHVVPVRVGVAGVHRVRGTATRPGASGTRAGSPGWPARRPPSPTARGLPPRSGAGARSLHKTATPRARSAWQPAHLPGVLGRRRVGHRGHAGSDRHPARRAGGGDAVPRRVGAADWLGTPAVTASAWAATAAGPWTAGEPPTGPPDPWVAALVVNRVVAGRSGYLEFQAVVTAPLSPTGAVRNRASGQRSAGTARCIRPRRPPIRPPASCPPPSGYSPSPWNDGVGVSWSPSIGDEIRLRGGQRSGAGGVHARRHRLRVATAGRGRHRPAHWPGRLRDAEWTFTGVLSGTLTFASQATGNRRLHRAGVSTGWSLTSVAPVAGGAVGPGVRVAGDGVPGGTFQVTTPSRITGG